MVVAVANAAHSDASQRLPGKKIGDLAVDRVKALGKALHERNAAARDNVRDSGTVLERDAERLLAQDGAAEPRRNLHELPMVCGGRADGDSIAFVHECFRVSPERERIFFSEGEGDFGVCVPYAGERHPTFLQESLCPEVGVVVLHAQKGDPQRHERPYSGATAMVLPSRAER